MNPKLTEARFDARLYRAAEGTGLDHVGTRERAQGIRFLCPCGTGHLIVIPFENPRDASALPRVGWRMTGTGLADLTLSPSIRTFGRDDGSECWHGFITNGEVLTC